MHHIPQRAAHKSGVDDSENHIRRKPRHGCFPGLQHTLCMTSDAGTAVPYVVWIGLRNGRRSRSTGGWCCSTDLGSHPDMPMRLQVQSPFVRRHILQRMLHKEHGVGGHP